MSSLSLRINQRVTLCKMNCGFSSLFLNKNINITFALILMLSQQSLAGYQTPQLHSDLSVCLCCAKRLR